MAMDATLEVTFCGRRFTAQEVELMRVVAHDYAGLGVTEIARTICELLQWKRPSGGLKNHECRQLLERLQAEGMVTLPALRKLGGRGPRRPENSRRYLCCSTLSLGGWWCGRREHLERVS